jgi:hypothetical protein
MCVARRGRASPSRQQDRLTAWRVSCAVYLGPGTIGDEPAAGYLGTGTVTSRCSPLLFMTLKVTFPEAEPAAMLLATARAVATFLPTCLHNDIPHDNPLLLGGTTRSHRNNDHALRSLWQFVLLAQLRCQCTDLQSDPRRILRSYETAKTSTTTARTLAIVRTNNVLDFTFRSRITILQLRCPQHLLDWEPVGKQSLYRQGI